MEPVGVHRRKKEGGRRLRRYGLRRYAIAELLRVVIPLDGGICSSLSSLAKYLFRSSYIPKSSRALCQVTRDEGQALVVCGPTCLCTAPPEAERNSCIAAKST